MFREASTMAIAPAPVPVPYETVPSYEIGSTRMRDESYEEYCSSSMPPKFIGSMADSDIENVECGMRSAEFDQRTLHRIPHSAFRIKERRSSYLCPRS